MTNPDLWQMLRAVRMGELREYLEELRDHFPEAFNHLKTHIQTHPPIDHKPNATHPTR